MAAGRIRQQIDWLLVVLLAVSVAGNVYLLGRLSANPESSLETPKARLDSPAVGDVLPPIDGVSIDGKKVNVDFAGVTPTVIYLFSKTCAWCDRNAVNAATLADKLAGNPGDFRFVALSTTPVSAGDALAKGLEAKWVVQPMSSAVLRQAHLTSTPATLVVAPGGRIEHLWMGAYTKTSKQSIERFFNLSLSDAIEINK